MAVPVFWPPSVHRVMTLPLAIPLWWHCTRKLIQNMHRTYIWWHQYHWPSLIPSAMWWWKFLKWTGNMLLRRQQLLQETHQLLHRMIHQLWFDLFTISISSDIYSNKFLLYRNDVNQLVVHSWPAKKMRIRQKTLNWNWLRQLFVRLYLILFYLWPFWASALASPFRMDCPSLCPECCGYLATHFRPQLYFCWVSVCLVAQETAKHNVQDS